MRFCELTLDFEADDEVPEVCDAVAALRRLALVAPAVVHCHVLDDQTPARKSSGMNQ